MGTALVNHGVKWERTGHTGWLNSRHNDVYRYIKGRIIERIFNLNKERSRQKRKREEMGVEEGRSLFNSLPSCQSLNNKNKSQFSFNHRYLSFSATQGIDCILHFARRRKRERQAFDRMPILSLLKQQLLFTLLSSSASKALITREREKRKRERESCLENFENLLLKRCYN